LWFRAALPTLGATVLALVCLLIGRSDNILIAGIVAGCGLVLIARAATEAREGWRSALQKSDAWIVLIAVLAGVAFAASKPDQLKEYYWATVYYQPFAAEAANDPLYYLKILVGDDPLFPLWVVLGAIALWRLPGSFGRFLIAGTLVPLLLMSTVFRFRVDRFMGFLFPLLCVLVAAGLMHAATLLRTRLSGGVTAQRAVVWGLVVAWAALAPWTRRVPEVITSKTGVYRGYSRSEFRTALAGVLHRVRADDAVVTGSALLVSCYIGRLADYALTDTFAEHPPEPSQHYSGAMRIRSRREMELVFASRERGWLIVHDENFSDPHQLSAELRAFILDRTRGEHAGDQKSVLVRSWGVEHDAQN
jgi:hypothetical protein